MEAALSLRFKDLRLILLRMNVGSVRDVSVVPFIVLVQIGSAVCVTTPSLLIAIEPPDVIHQMVLGFSFPNSNSHRIRAYVLLTRSAR